ncbi:MAG: TonB-dependent receptor, partial [Muribaculaceae bacterium]|nr:TonB-dependent receptor [Muribaculaceae bacterium]
MRTFLVSTILIIESFAATFPHKVTKLICVFLLMPVSAFSQYCMQGKVTDENGTGINEVQIYLYQNGELEVLTHTDANGEYRTGKVPQGKYHVVVSCMGFSSKEDSVAIDQDITLDFILETRSIMLDSIVVEGRSSRFTSKGHVFFLSKKAKECGNPFVALQEIPLLYSDPVSESVRSSDGQSMMILIDGMRVNSGISPIDPSRIQSVEIIDVVGAKYMRQGVKRIMNIKLKETSLYTYIQLSAR